MAAAAQSWRSSFPKSQNFRCCWVGMSDVRGEQDVCYGRAGSVVDSCGRSVYVVVVLRRVEFSETKHETRRHGSCYNVMHGGIGYCGPDEVALIVRALKFEWRHPWPFAPSLHQCGVIWPIMNLKSGPCHASTVTGIVAFVGSSLTCFTAESEHHSDENEWTWEDHRKRIGSTCKEYSTSTSSKTHDRWPEDMRSIVRINAHKQHAPLKIR